MTKTVSINRKSGNIFKYEEIKIVPQQIVTSRPLPLLDNIQLRDLPDDYLNYIDFFGEGLLGDYLRIFPINFINNLIIPWRNQSLRNTFFNNNTVLSYEQLPKSIIIGDTLDNSQFIYFDRCYYIYNVEVEEFVINVGESINNIFEWFINGDFWESTKLDTFMPFNSDKTISPLSRIIGSFFYDYERKF